MKISLPAVNGEFYLVAEINGNKIKRFIPCDGEMYIDGLSAGELRAEVKHYLKSELVKGYKVEPLILKEVDGKLLAEPEIIAMCREIGELKKTIAAERKAVAELKESYKSNIEEHGEQMKKLRTNLFALTAFAYSDYRKNVYLGGENIEGFCKEFGFELTDEEKKILEEINRNED